MAPDVGIAPQAAVGRHGRVELAHNRPDVEFWYDEHHSERQCQMPTKWAAQLPISAAIRCICNWNYASNRLDVKFSVMNVVLRHNARWKAHIMGTPAASSAAVCCSCRVNWAYSRPEARVAFICTTDSCPGGSTALLL